jgi:hypothetical protein
MQYRDFKELSSFAGWLEESYLIDEVYLKAFFDGCQ